ncbi:MAG: MATE family efflux transporter, partial [Bacilli bacterium]|nr:MATE family efflux transporter [Bacilli bacterium]
MENNTSNKYLGEEKISKLLLKFSIPCILSLLISALYNIVDQIFIGHSTASSLGNAATGIVYPITIICMAFAWCIGDGSAAYLSICQGKKDTKNAHKAIGNNILIIFIISLICVLLCFVFMGSILEAFGATKDIINLENGFSSSTFNLAKDYFTILLIFMPGYMMTNAITSVIRADGAPAYSMAANLSGAITNIILDPIFIFVFKMGIKGAAWATIIGELVSFIIAFSYLFKSKTFKLKLESFKIDMKVFSNVIKLGISTFITQMAIVAISLVCNSTLVKYGAGTNYGTATPIAVMSICMKVFSIVINIIVGIIVGGQPILGYNYGAGKYNRVKETYRIVAISTIIVGVIATICFELFPTSIVKIFGNGGDIYYNEFAIMTFRIFLMLVLVTCFIKMTSIFFQAVGEPVKATTVSLTRDLLFFVPLAFILPRFMGIKGVLYAAPIADALALIVTIPLIITFFKKIDHVDNPETKTAVIKPSKPGIIITIAREHGSQGKYIGELVAKKLNIPYYYKEMTALAAEESGLAAEYVSKLNDNSPSVMYELYMSTTPVQEAIKAQDKIIKKIADNGSCVIVGRASNYVLRDYENTLNIFI